MKIPLNTKAIINFVVAIVNEYAAFHDEFKEKLEDYEDERFQRKLFNTVSYIITHMYHDDGVFELEDVHKIFVEADDRRQHHEFTIESSIPRGDDLPRESSYEVTTHVYVEAIFDTLVALRSKEDVD